MKIKQPATIVLPQSGIWVEIVTDMLLHYSIPILTDGLDEKMINLEAVAPPVPGIPNLVAWVEVSSWSSTAGFAMVGSPIVIVNNPLGDVQIKAIAWTLEAKWARLVVQCPIVGGAWAAIAAFEARI